MRNARYMRLCMSNESDRRVREHNCRAATRQIPSLQTSFAVPSSFPDTQQVQTTGIRYSSLSPLNKRTVCEGNSKHRRDVQFHVAYGSGSLPLLASNFQPRLRALWSGSLIRPEATLSSMLPDKYIFTCLT